MRSYALVCLLVAAPGPRGETKTWDVTKREALARGEEFDGVVLTARGGLRLGFTSTATEVKGEPSFWSGCLDGDVLWVGTGKGAIYKIAGGVAEKAHETGEMLVTSIVKHDGALYAATIPNGRIFTNSGGWKLHATMPSKLAWQLAVHGGRLVAACGSPGALYEVAAEPKKLWPVSDLKVENVLSLAADGDALLLGTAAPGYVVRLAEGTSRILHDFGEGEVKALVASTESIHAAVNNGQKVPPSQFLQAVESAEKKEGAAPAPPGPVSGAVWRISPERTEKAIEFPTSYVTDLARREDGVFIGTNNSGRVFRLTAEGPELAFDFPEGQVLAFVGDAKRLSCLMGNRAAVRSFGTDRAARGHYVSDVLDARFPSQWGTLARRGTGAIKVETRSGAIAKAGEGWSAWEEPKGDKVASPKARFLQFRITITDAAAEARGVTVAYRNENQRPVIREVRVEAVPAKQDGMRAEQPGPSPRLGEGHSGIKRIQWQPADDDGDYLVFRVYIRAVDGTAWLPLLGKGSVAQPEHQWSTENVPDGRYVVKVVASDEQANPASEALTGEAETDAILVDNTKPDVTVTVEGAKLTGTASDGVSTITRIEVQVDGGEWKSITPKDRLFDDLKEEFELELKELKAGAHTVTVRALDRESNAGLATKSFEVK